MTTLNELVTEQEKAVADWISEQSDPLEACLLILCRLLGVYLVVTRTLAVALELLGTEEVPDENL